MSKPQAPSFPRRASPCRGLFALVHALIALVTAFLLMQYATGGRVAYTMDSLTYRDAALNFIAGYPMEATNVAVETPKRLPLLVWPPAYPALWASFAARSNASIDETPTLLNPVLLSVSVLSAFWVCWLVTGRSSIACVVATVSAFTPTSMIVFGHAWSETLFIPLILVAYAAFWQYRISQGRFIWLAAAATFIGIANWVRYAGVAYFPILALSVLIASSVHLSKRIVHAAGAMLLGILLVLPLWLRNWQLSGNLSGSTRGGVPKAGRLFEDSATIVDLFEHSFFSFSMVLRANLEIPIILAIGFLIFRAFRRHGVQWLQPPEIWLPLVWLLGYLAFLLYARTRQVGVPLDLRMIAVTFPFLLLTLAPAVSAAFPSNLKNVQSIVVALLLGLLVNSGFHEASKTHDNYASAGVPRWRSTFALAFRDMRDTSPTSRALLESIGPVASSSLILTDYRALYIRYLTGAQAYSPPFDSECPNWANHYADGRLLIGSTELPAWATKCRKMHPQWRLLRPTGRAAPSIYAD